MIHKKQRGQNNMDDFISADNVKEVQTKLGDQLISKERSPNRQPASPNLDLTIYNLLKEGLNPAKICIKLQINKTRVDYYLSSLKDRQLIRKLGYGVYEIIGDYTEKKSKSTTRVAMNDPHTNLDLFKPDTVRGHAFVFTLSINPNLRNWDKREEIFKKMGIEYEPLKIFGGGQSIIFKGRKTWLTSKSIIVYEKASYMSETSTEAKQYAVYDFISHIGALERFLKADFGATRGRLKFKVSRQHYALIKNSLAKQYDREGKKLQVVDQRGRQWFIIDNSFNLNEAETIDPETGDIDNLKVQTHFNNIKETPLQVLKDYTPQFVLNAMQGIQNNQVMYSENIASHIKAIQDLGVGVNKLVELITKLESKQ